MVEFQQHDGGSAAPRRGIQSVEIGLGLLLALAKAPGALTLKEIAAASGLPASNCHRYLVSFVRMGFIKQDPRTGAYDLGPALLQAGLAAMGRLDAIGIATDTLERIVEETGQAGMVAIWADNGPTIVRWIQGPRAVHTTLAPGSTLPLLTTATGQMFLTFLPGRQTASLRQKEASDAAPDIDALCRKVRRDRLSTVSGDHIPGLNAAASPILDAAGEIAASLTLVSAGAPFAPETLASLRRHAEIASGLLGWIDRTPVGNV